MIFDSRSQPHGSPSLDGATIRHPKSRDWEPCAKCGERLEFGTNGMGELVPSCPVCDWGWRPSRDYAAYRQRLQLPMTPPEEIAELPRWEARQCACGTWFQPTASAHKHCSNACIRKAHNECQQRIRDERHARGICTNCGEHPSRPRRRTCGKCRVSAKERKQRWLRKYYANRNKAA